MLMNWSSPFVEEKKKKKITDPKQLEQIDDLIFSELTELKLLFLDTNQITVFSRNAFVKLTKLETVCLCENPISNYFPFLLKDICRTNPNCVLSIQQCCFNSKTLENFF